MAPLVRTNAPKAVKDRARTLQHKAKELHEVMQHNPSLQLPGRVATLAETKPGYWEVFSSCEPEDLPIDFSQMNEFEIKYPDNYRTIAESAATVGQAIIAGPVSTQHANSAALIKTSMDIHSHSFYRTPTPQRPVPQASFLLSPTSRASPDRHKTSPDLPALQTFAVDSAQSTDSDVSSLGRPATEYHSHSLPPTNLGMPHIAALPEQYNHSSCQAGPASIPAWTPQVTVNPHSLAAFNGMPIGHYGGHSHGQLDKPTPPARPCGLMFSSTPRVSSVQHDPSPPTASPICSTDSVTPAPRNPSTRVSNSHPLASQATSCSSSPGLGGKATRPSSVVASIAGLSPGPRVRPLTPASNLLLACQTPRSVQPEFSPSPSAVRSNLLHGHRSIFHTPLSDLRSTAAIQNQATTHADHPLSSWDSDQDSGTTMVVDRYHYGQQATYTLRFGQ